MSEAQRIGPGNCLTKTQGCANSKDEDNRLFSGLLKHRFDDVLEVVDIINRFYQEDKKHKVGVAQDSMTQEEFDADHKEELDAYNAALRYFKVHLDGAKYSTKKLAGEQAQLSENIASKTEALTAVQEDVKILRDVRHWLNQVLPSEQYRQTAEPGKKPSIQQAVKGREQRIREEQAEKRQTPRRQQKQDMEL